MNGTIQVGSMRPFLSWIPFDSEARAITCVAFTTEAFQSPTVAGSMSRHQQKIGYGGEKRLFIFVKSTGISLAAMIIIVIMVM